MFAALLLSASVQAAATEKAASETHSDIETCSPQGLDLCKYARIFVAAVNEKANSSSAKGGKETASEKRAYAAGPSIVIDITLRQSRREVVRDIGEDSADAHAEMIGVSHADAVGRACGAFSRFVEHGGRFDVIYRFIDGELLTRASVRSCALDSRTWSEDGLDHCTPFGADICALAERLRDELASRIEPAELTFARDPEIQMVTRAVRVERDTLVVERVLHLEAERGEILIPYDVLRKDSTASACNYNLRKLIVRGRRVRFEHDYRDGTHAGDFTIARCPPDSSTQDQIP